MNKTIQCFLLVCMIAAAYAAFRGIVDYQPAGSPTKLDQPFLELDKGDSPPQQEELLKDLSKSELRINVENWLIKRYKVDRVVAEAISAEAEDLEHGMMLVAILSVESKGDPKAKLANNYGLCQISDVHFEPEEMKRIRQSNYPSLEDCGIENTKDLFDIAKNMCAANAVFDRLYRTSKGSARTALINYNANDRLKYDYQRKVLSNYRSLAQAANLPSDYKPMSKDETL